MVIKNPLFLKDFYKADHRRQYPEGTELVYSNLTPRQSRIPNVNSVVFFGLQYFIKEYLIKQWNENFFNREKSLVIAEYQILMDECLGPNAIPVEHVKELHDLGYLPIRIKALPEGVQVPIRVPMLTIVNTDKRFFWITNYLETLISAILWKPITSATTAFQYRKEFERHAALTGSPKDFIGWQGHDFSFRGMSGVEDACMSGGAHLTSFTGTDTVPAIPWLQEYYNATGLIGGSVPATEHSVMCMGMEDGEFETFKNLITKVYPSGIISIVSDTWDFWKVLNEYLPALREEILSRDGRVVIRPDSGDPVDIICGSIDILNLEDSRDLSHANDVAMDRAMTSVRDATPHGEEGPSEVDQYFTYGGKNYKTHVNIFWNRYDKRYYFIEEYNNEGPEEVELNAVEMGAYEVLWSLFGGEVIDGYRHLNTKIGLIYGDSITTDRQKEILRRLEAKGFTASNLVLGIGSYTYEYVTRDTYGMAMKATYGEVNGEGRPIFKDPKTDSGVKKSAKGLLSIRHIDETDSYSLVDEVNWDEEKNQSHLEIIYENGNLVVDHSLDDIRKRINSNF